MRRTWRVTPWRSAFMRERCLPAEDLGPVERFAFSRLISARLRFAVDVDRAICAVPFWHRSNEVVGRRSQESEIRSQEENGRLRVPALDFCAAALCDRCG